MKDMLFTLADIDETIALMEQRATTGQGTLRDAMCRLSLTMTHILRGKVEELEGKLNTIAAAYNHISSPSGTNDPMELVVVIRQILEDGT